MLTANADHVLQLVDFIHHPAQLFQVAYFGGNGHLGGLLIFIGSGINTHHIDFFIGQHFTHIAQ